VAQQKNVSDATAEVIDQEVRSIVDGAEQKCRDILTERNDDLHTLAKALLEYETLTGEEIGALLRGEPIVREKDDDPEPPPVRSSVPTSGKPITPGPEPEPQGG
jgi:cell division protease FtsH